MSANTIIDQAPLGALIRYTDGSPKPPARFTKKLLWLPPVMQEVFDPFGV